MRVACKQRGGQGYPLCVGRRRGGDGEEKTERRLKRLNARRLQAIAPCTTLATDFFFPELRRLSDAGEEEEEGWCFEEKDSECDS